MAAAYELRDRADVVLLEAGDRLGGNVRTFRLDGIRLEGGPDSLLARDEGPLKLLEELGLRDQIVEPTDFGAWVVIKGRLRRMPAGFVLGVPASPAALIRSGVLSPIGMIRAAADLILPGRLTTDDVAVGSFIRRRFGSEVAEHLVDPLMAGTRAGDIDRMSLRMAAAPIYEIARRHRSVTLGLRASRGSSTPPRFIGLRTGMQTLVDALRDAASPHIEFGARVTKISRTSDGFSLLWDGGEESADAVVISAPAHAAAKMLTDVAPRAVEMLEELTFASVAVVNLVYPAGAISVPPGGSGLLVPKGEGRSIVACTWFSSKWPHAAPPDGRTVLRCVLGREEGDLQGDDDSLVRAAIADVSLLLEARGAPVSHAVDRWEKAAPQFEVGHLARIAAIETSLPTHKLAIAGAGYRATGLNDCLAHGAAAARSVLGAQD